MKFPDSRAAEQSNETIALRIIADQSLIVCSPMTMSMTDQRPPGYLLKIGNEIAKAIDVQYVFLLAHLPAERARNNNCGEVSRGCPG